MIRESTLWGILVGLLLFTIGSSIFWEYDSTDDIVNKKRSGIELYVDYGTGCEYLLFQKGFIFTHVEVLPRLDKNGKHICNR